MFEVKAQSPCKLVRAEWKDTAGGFLRLSFVRESEWLSVAIWQNVASWMTEKEHEDLCKNIFRSLQGILDISVEDIGYDISFKEYCDVIVEKVNTMKPTCRVKVGVKNGKKEILIPKRFFTDWICPDQDGYDMNYTEWELNNFGPTNEVLRPDETAQKEPVSEPTTQNPKPTIDW